MGLYQVLIVLGLYVPVCKSQVTDGWQIVESALAPLTLWKVVSELLVSLARKPSCSQQLSLVTETSDRGPDGLGGEAVLRV